MKKYKATLEFWVEGEERPDLDDLVNGILEGLPKEWFIFQPEFGDNYRLCNLHKWNATYVD